ncbi:alpha/beta hydrolase [Amycolatopsis carbonis]|uniref:Alpha/beta hydrolase n=1 Tax=Amycolatopsis carbonis TaxID=715471 RepID=A0A9Y2I9B1_9PSEU|nr:alpha/beta hydrolase [Amycolatopsis sp. 2-15]WIX75061.1 alpha/beta hydrolase [Amycolatopsis sp. 2-15]
MTYALDPELGPVPNGVAARERGDWRALRESGNAGQAYLATLVPPAAGVTTATHFATAPDATAPDATAPDGTAIELRWYTTGATARPGPAVVYAHGGGMVLGSLDLYDTLLSWYVARSGVPFLSVGYRLAPEVTGTTLAEDVFAGLTWLVEHAPEMGVDAARIAVMGDSGGGAPAAGAAILARERDVRLARQILVYPMLDDRTQALDPARAPYFTWTPDDNFTAWSAVLGDTLGTPSVSPVAAPARLTDFAGLAPAYVETGDLDLFRDEDIAYARSLGAVGVPVELHVHPGVPHGWDRFAPDAHVSRRAFGDRLRVLGEL